ncbi:hypothetical protein Q2329_25345, partial [Escherichia coli]|nr:hypothetical protein [Escherichia coli]
EGLSGDPPRKNNNGIADNTRELTPLAAAPATERSERAGEEAEFPLPEHRNPYARNWQKNS